jgi:hypothetical protein
MKHELSTNSTVVDDAIRFVNERAKNEIGKRNKNKSVYTNHETSIWKHKVRSYLLLLSTSCNLAVNATS